MKYSHVLFDLDNTLLNFSSASLKALESIAAAIQVEYNDEFLDKYHKINHQVWQAFELGTLDLVSLRRLRFEETAKLFGRQVDGMMLNRKYIQGIIAHGSFMPNALEIIEHFYSSCSLHIITNGLKEAQRPRLKQSGIIDYFDQIIVSDEIGAAKPNIEYFTHTWERIGKPDKNTVLVVGDSPNSDILGGNNFGFRTCLYDPFSKHKNPSSDYIIKDLLQLKDIQRI